MTEAGSPVVVLLDERDYQYGEGPLRIRVNHVDRANPVVYDGEDWYRVTGVAVRGDGVDLGPRHVLVRGRRLPR